MLNISFQSLARSPFWIGLTAIPFSLISTSHVLGGTSTAGEQLKNPCGCHYKQQKTNQIMSINSDAQRKKQEILNAYEQNTMSVKPMRSTGITGQSSSRGMCVIPNTYLYLFDNTNQIQHVKYMHKNKIIYQAMSKYLHH